MVTDQQVRRYLKRMKREKTKAVAAAKSGMDVQTACKYEKLGKLPSELKRSHTWRPEKMKQQLSIVSESFWKIPEISARKR